MVVPALAGFAGCLRQAIFSAKLPPPSQILAASPYTTSDDNSETALTDEVEAALQGLLEREDTLSELAAIKQDAKHFRPHMMARERSKRAALATIYDLARVLLPQLDISQQNVTYYASLAHYYTIYNLRRLQPGQTRLYLLCYAWQRYRQLNDNLADALRYHTKKFEDDSKTRGEQQFMHAQVQRQKETTQVGKLLLLYVDETLDDTTPFGSVRHQAFSIMPKAALLQAGQRLSNKSVSQMELRWHAVDAQAGQFRSRLRPQAMALNFCSVDAADPWLAALRWMTGVFGRRQRLEQRPLSEVPPGTIPKRLRPYLLTFNDADQPAGLRGERYEFWIYRQIRKRIDSGALHLDDSIRHRRFSDHLVTPDRVASVLDELDLAWLRQPYAVAIDELFDELHEQWQAFDRELRQGKLKHLDYDAERAKLTWRKPKANKESEAQTDFYARLPLRDIADIFRFVNDRCDFTSAMTPLQPRYAKKVADEDSLMAVIIAQATNLGNFSMAQTCDIPYHVLEATHQQYCRLANLQAANDRISNFVAQLPIFDHYSFGIETLFGSVDGQKFASATPTTKARHSKKYFGGGKGVVAFTLLVNHLALRTNLLGANEHESHYVFDICYNNTTDIVPDMITGDMHSINKANFAALYWFGKRLAPRFTSLQAQLPHLYCGNDIGQYARYLIKPAGQMDRSLLDDGEADVRLIIASLGLKEMSQQTLIRKLCALSAHHPTRKVVFEFDKLVRSIYTLRYLRDPQLQRDVHRSQNRIEAYHQLRSVIAQIGGKKHLIGRTDLAIAISNECGRLLANIVIAFNSVLLSALFERYQREGNHKALAMLAKISPVAWQHIHFLGHYIFRGNLNPIDLTALLASLDLT